MNLTTLSEAVRDSGEAAVNAVSSVESESKTKSADVHPSARYTKVLDGRKQPIRGLWERNGKFIARINVEDEAGKKRAKWIPLKGAGTVAQARAELGKLMVKREANDLPVLKRTPKFSDYVEDYLSYFDTVKDAKRPRTIAKEKGALKLWKAHLGDTRLDKVSRAQINSFIKDRQGAGMSGRTVNLDVIALRNVMKRGIDDGWIKTLPTVNLRPLKHTSRKRALVTFEEIERVCAAAKGATKNYQEFSDYIRLMSFAGSRRDETLRICWADVDFARKQLTVGADGLAKNHESRVVDFNADLEAHLLDMFARRDPASKFLFPSPQRGDKDESAKTFRESLDLAREASGLKHFSFHDCRHHFISMGVMAGIDFMTLASWVGHKDGGVLIGKVYGHLANDHKQRMAASLVFRPQAAAPVVAVANE